MTTAFDQFWHIRCQKSPNNNNKTKKPIYIAKLIPSIINFLELYDLHFIWVFSIIALQAWNQLSDDIRHTTTY